MYPRTSYTSAFHNTTAQGHSVSTVHHILKNNRISCIPRIVRSDQAPKIRSSGVYKSERSRDAVGINSGLHIFKCAANEDEIRSASYYSSDSRNNCNILENPLLATETHTNNPAVES